jgi:hypothetical protein
MHLLLFIFARSSKNQPLMDTFAPLPACSMRWPWIRDARPIEPRPKVLELQTAKEILAEVFHARPGEVEEMI